MSTPTELIAEFHAASAAYEALLSTLQGVMDEQHQFDARINAINRAIDLGSFNAAAHGQEQAEAEILARRAKFAALRRDLLPASHRRQAAALAVLPIVSSMAFTPNFDLPELPPEAPLSGMES